MGGKISFESVYQKGTTFTINLEQDIVDKSKVDFATYKGKKVAVNRYFDGSKYKILLVDDNILNLKVAEKMLKKYDLDVTSVKSGLECINYTKHRKYDLIFLDIHMKFQDGMTTAKKIRELDDSVIIVFITALAQYAIEGYKVNALDFILKPVVYEQLEGTLDKVLKIADKYHKSKEIIVADDGAKRKIDTEDIYYIEVVGHTIVIHSKAGVFETRGKTLKAIAEELNEFGFVQSVQSHLINLKFVDKIKGDVVTVAGDDLFLSRSRKKDFIAAFAEYVGMEI